MATFDLPFQRRKLTTYGKLVRKPSNNLWDLEASPEKPTPRQHDLRSDLSPSQRTSAGKLTRPTPQTDQAALFDVPSSDEESSQSAPNIPPSKASSSTNEKCQIDAENPKKRKRNDDAQRSVAIGGDDLMERIQTEFRAAEADKAAKIEEHHRRELKDQVGARILKRRQKKTYATTSTAGNGLRKGKSAPAALQSMLSESESTMEATTPE